MSYRTKGKKESKSMVEDVLTPPEVLDVAEDIEEVEETEDKKPHMYTDMLEQIMFKLPIVSDPLIGTPKEVQAELDAIVLKIQKRPNSVKSNYLFNKIHLYIHGYLINVVLKKFPYIKGFQTVDIYQETLIALRFKAIPNFRNNKGMSFLNFAKMCIKRHLITLLNTSQNRIRDRSINRAVSIHVRYGNGNNEDDRNTLENTLADGAEMIDVTVAKNEAYDVTKKTLMNNLSSFEKIVLHEYLTTASYREISKNITKRFKSKYNTKSIDNALLRIRKKATYLKKHTKFEEIPIFIKK